MKHAKRQNGFSLIEILVVIAIMAILAGASIKIGSVLQTQAKTKNTKTAITTLVDALKVYKLDRDKRDGRFAFPPDPMMVFDANGTLPHTWIAVTQCFYDMNAATEGSILISVNYPAQMMLSFNSTNSNTIVNSHNNPLFWEDAGDLDATQINYRIAALGSIEVLYAYLADVPGCVEVLNKLPQNLTANDDNDSLAFVFGGGGQVQAGPLYEVNDAWGAPLRYRNMGKGNFPEIVSAGKDGEFNTADDIVSGEE